MTDHGQAGLRARRQARTRAAIVTAALDLFVQRGYDAVTVTDIAARADIGRTTFFRYFADKSDVLFADGPELTAVLLGAAAEAAAADPDPDGSPGHALRIARPAMRALIGRIEQYDDRLAAYQSIIGAQDGLRARSLLKQEQYMTDLSRALAGHGVPVTTARLTANLMLACYRTAHEAANGHAGRLGTLFDEMVDQMAAIGRGVVPTRAG